MKNRVKISTDPVANYIFHMLSVSNVDFNGEYSVLFENTVIENDREFLRECRKFLSNFNGGNGILFDLIVRMPIYFNFGEKDDFRKFSYLLETCFENNDFTDMEVYYNEKYLDFDLWQGFSTEKYLDSVRDYREIITEVLEIFYRNHDSFIREVWDKEKDRLEEVAENIRVVISGEDIISKWELFGNTDFEKDYIDFILVSAVLNGIPAISSGYDRKILSADFSRDIYSGIITYETGINIFNKYLQSVLQSGKYPVREVYDCYEAVIYYFSRIISGSDCEIYQTRNSGILESIGEIINSGYEDIKDLMDKVLSKRLRNREFL